MKNPITREMCLDLLEKSFGNVFKQNTKGKQKNLTRIKGELKTNERRIKGELKAN